MQDVWSLSRALPALLGGVGRARGALLCVVGADALRAARWLPERLPINVKMIVTVTEGGTYLLLLKYLFLSCIFLSPPPSLSLFPFLFHPFSLSLFHSYSLSLTLSLSSYLSFSPVLHYVCGVTFHS